MQSKAQGRPENNHPINQFLGPIHSEIKIRSKVNRVHRRVRALTYDYDHAWSVSYEVDGQPHVCSGKRTYSSDTIAYRKLAERKVGTAALVHYNPEDHTESRLDGKYGEPPALAFALGGLFSMMGVGMLVIAMAFESQIESNLPGSLRDLQDVEQPPSQPYVPRNQKPVPGECDLSQTNLESASTSNSCNSEENRNAVPHHSPSKVGRIKERSDAA
ncbi:MAG: hypothetical protein AB8G99_05895, partial [Planctomycetaceae bacterium]